ncbi:hypothetical protein M0Q97_12360 [Candidatus Dojkabacteria bacterium]|jgi:hypothetical protein|nr:hypothetical protein [Candidatus Dojkabacteria bacterium]
MNKKESNNFFTRIFHKLLLLINPDDILTQDTQIAFEIFKTCLEQPDNMYLLNIDLSGEKYIVPKSYYSSTNEMHKSTCIILNDFEKKITIVNHTYQYDMLFPQKTYNMMERMFENKVKEERQKMKSEILKNTIKSLEIVLNNLKNNN